MVQIKTISTTDYERLTTFFTENDVDEVTRWFFPFPLNQASAYKITHSAFSDKYYWGLVGSKPVGFSMLRGWDEGYEIPSFGMFIDHRSMGMGYGGQLLDLTIEQAEAERCPGIRLSVFEKNVIAYNLYISRGFIEAERLQKPIGDAIESIIVMMRTF